MRLHGIARFTFSLMLLGQLTSSALSAQSKEGTSDASVQGQKKTVVGCLTGYDGRYTLGASNDMLYLLDGDTDQFKRLNAKMVRATGIVSEPIAETSKHDVLSQQPPTMKVTSLKKVADGCN